MKVLLAVVFIILCLNSVAQTKGLLPRYIFIIRHAEKKSGSDPELTEAGKQRAGDLLRVLKKKNIQAIYVTQFKRTQMTSDSLRIKMGIDTVHYLADTLCNDLLKKITARHDRSILIIGHSNTIAYIIHKFAGANLVIKEIGEAEYNNLFLLKTKGNIMKLEVMQYGKQPKTPDKMQ